MDDPRAQLEEILPLGARDPRERRVAAIFGLPGLAAAFLAGTLSGIAFGAVPMPAAGPVDTASPSASVEASASLDPSASASARPTVRPTARPSGTPGPAPSPTPRRYALDENSVPWVKWPPALQALVATTPESAQRILLTPPDEWWQGDHTWGLQFDLPPDDPAVWPWAVGLPDELRALGFGSATVTVGIAAGTVRYVDAPGFALTAMETFREGRPVVHVVARVSDAALRTDGRFRDDRRGELVRRGCIAKTAPKGPAALAAAVRAAGAISIETAFCPRSPEPGQQDWEMWRTVATLPGSVDAADLTMRLAAVFAAAGRDVRIGWWADMGGGELSVTSAGSVTWVIQMAMTHEDWVSSWYTIGTDPLRPDIWRVELMTVAADLLPDGGLRPDPAPSSPSPSPSPSPLPSPVPSPAPSGSPLP